MKRMLITETRGWKQVSIVWTIWEAELFMRREVHIWEHGQGAINSWFPDISHAPVGKSTLCDQCHHITNKAIPRFVLWSIPYHDTVFCQEAPGLIWLISCLEAETGQDRFLSAKQYSLSTGREVCHKHPFDCPVRENLFQTMRVNIHTPPYTNPVSIWSSTHNQ